MRKLTARKVGKKYIIYDVNNRPVCFLTEEEVERLGLNMEVLNK